MLRNLLLTIAIFVCIQNFSFTQVKNTKNLITKSLSSPSDKKFFVKSAFTFPNVGEIYYYNSNEIFNLIQKYKTEENWDSMHDNLYKYINNFGIGNFVNNQDMELLWIFARLSEYLNKDITKDAYRLIIKHYRGNLQDALHKYDSLIQFDKDLYADLDYYYSLVERRKSIDTLVPARRVLVNMGPSINSLYDDYSPSIDRISSNLIYFSSNRNISYSSVSSSFGEDIYLAYYDSLKGWHNTIEFDKINTQYNEGSPFISYDNLSLLFVRCNSFEGFGDCDIYEISRNSDKKWGTPVNLGPNVNSESWDSHPSYTYTKDTIYFASNRTGGFGGSDIYYSVRAESGEWGKARNLGCIINTQFDELSPYYYPFYDILYFSSTGHLFNFGDFDIFKSYLVNDQLTEPKNLGPLVNTERREYYFTIDIKDKHLYYARSVEDDKNLDLYSYPLPMEAQPNSIVIFEGKAIDSLTGKIFSGIVSIIDMDKQVEVAPKHLHSDGSFEFHLIDKRNYLLIIDGDNFFRVEKMFYLDGNTKMEIPLTTTRGLLTFESIDFNAGSSEILPAMENNLHSIIDFLINYLEFNLKIIGHTSSEGSKDTNDRLSKERANSIREYILSYSYSIISPERVIAIGTGSSSPIVRNELTEKDKKLNRRVEFELYTQD